MILCASLDSMQNIPFLSYSLKMFISFNRFSMFFTTKELKLLFMDSIKLFIRPHILLLIEIQLFI